MIKALISYSTAQSVSTNSQRNYVELAGRLKRKTMEKLVFLIIFFYVIYVLISVLEWLLGDGGVPITAVVVGIALPYIRKNHLHQIQLKEGTNA
ncbi:hypothetical protein [Rossellomorea vietnamensis]|jgi:hypothetical protein|uniref:hypothetical protein n=1 Tax=Rossellomorea vietnamensis TaxID=218284 RepID=UPI003D27FC28